MSLEDLLPAAQLATSQKAQPTGLEALLPAAQLATRGPAAPVAPMPDTNPTATGTQNFAAAAGKAVADAGRGAKQLLDIPAVWLEKKFPGVSRWAQEKGMPSAADSAQATNADVAESRKLDAPLMDTWAGVAGNVTGQIATAMLPLGAAKAAGVPLAGALTGCC